MTQAPPNLWYLKDYAVTERPDGIQVTATTDALCDLLMVVSYKKWRVNKEPQIRRGAYIHDKVTVSMSNATVTHQVEPGYTLTHTFFLPIATRNTTVYFYFAAYLPTAKGKGTSAPFKHYFVGVDMYVISLARYGDGPGLVLDGAVTLEEGTGITITRDPAKNSLKITSEAGGAPGFFQPLLHIHSAHPAFDVVNPTFGQLSFGAAYNGDNLRVYTPMSHLYNFKYPHVMQVAVMRGDQNPNLFTVYLAMLYNQTNLHNDLNHAHIAFICRDNKIYASNADGAARTETQVAGVGPYTTTWLRWKRTIAGIEFYVDGTLMATHTTNLPPDQYLCSFLYQYLSLHTEPASFYATEPKYSEV